MAMPTIARLNSPEAGIDKCATAVYGVCVCLCVREGGGRVVGAVLLSACLRVVRGIEVRIHGYQQGM